MKERKVFRRFTPVLAILLVASVSAFAKNTRKLNVAYPASLGAAHLEAGEYNVTWESHSPAVTVTFKQGKNVVATAEGKWVERGTSYEASSIVYDTDSDGSRRIIEIRFAGLSQALVLGGSASASAQDTQPAQPQAGSTQSGSSPAAQVRFVGKPKAPSHPSDAIDLNSIFAQELFQGGPLPAVPSVQNRPGRPNPN